MYLPLLPGIFFRLMTEFHHARSGIVRLKLLCSLNLPDSYWLSVGAGVCHKYLAWVVEHWHKAEKPPRRRAVPSLWAILSKLGRYSHKQWSPVIIIMLERERNIKMNKTFNEINESELCQVSGGALGDTLFGITDTLSGTLTFGSNTVAGAATNFQPLVNGANGTVDSVANLVNHIAYPVAS